MRRLQAAAENPQERGFRGSREEAAFGTGNEKMHDTAKRLRRYHQAFNLLASWALFATIGTCVIGPLVVWWSYNASIQDIKEVNGETKANSYWGRQLLVNPYRTEMPTDRKKMFGLHWYDHAKEDDDI